LTSSASLLTFDGALFGRASSAAAAELLPSPAEPAIASAVANARIPPRAIFRLLNPAFDPLFTGPERDNVHLLFTA
jgi:hypothetical protein